MKLIPLSKQGKNKGKYFAIVDDEDYDELIKYNWCVHGTNKVKYAVRSIGGKINHMHRIVMKLELDNNLVVDHKDHNGLNNQKCNLRVCTHSQNQTNVVSYRGRKHKGVYRVKNYIKNPWRAAISVGGKWKHLGYFPTEKKALQAYNSAQLIYRGEFSVIRPL